jgi:hypothetical protein
MTSVMAIIRMFKKLDAAAIFHMKTNFPFRVRGGLDGRLGALKDYR